MRKKKIFIWLVSIIVGLSVIASAVIGVTYLYVRKNIDFSIDEGLFTKNQTGTLTRFYYNSTPEKNVYTPKELCSIAPFRDKKVWFSYDEIGENLKNAFISAEDRDFFSHNGVNVKRSLYAVANYFLKAKPTFGASTITQQVIKNISGDNEQTVKRKVEEVIRAINIENHHTKEEIFELYLNIVPMGEGISGVGLASEYYFGKLPSELSLEESATIVGITNAPSKYNPHNNYGECLKKRNAVLYSMLDNGVINEEEYETAKNSPLAVMEKHSICDEVNSWFCETVISDVVSDLVKKKNISNSAGRLLVMNGGLTVYTTVDPKIQSILEEYFENLANLPQKCNEGLDFGMVVINSHTSDIVATVGGVGKKTANSITNNILVPHPPASTLKPLALYAPLINRNRINWATVFDDVPVIFNKNGENYTEYPKNYPDVYDGLITVSDALRVSKNTVAVRLSKLIGEEKIFKSLTEDFGFNTLVKEKQINGKTVTDISLSPLALGQLTYGVSLRKLTEAYTVFAREGVGSNSRSYISVFNSDGELILENTKNEKRIFSIGCARIINQLLMRVVENGTAKSVTLGKTVDTAGKTGTSSADRDRLFVGYTPYYTAGIWCGYPNQNKEISSLDKTHLNVWDEIMLEIHRQTLSYSENTESFSTEGLVYLPYCKASGMIFGDACALDPRGECIDYGYFYPYNKPRGVCNRHVLCDYDELTGGVATDGCDREFVIKTALLDIPDRKFPKEIYVTDAQYVYRRLASDVPPATDSSLPYFMNMLGEGEYCGISKSKKQYNSSCHH